MSILLKEMAEKAGVRELWCFFCFCFRKESKTKSLALRVSEVAICRLGECLPLGLERQWAVFYMKPVQCGWHCTMYKRETS